MNNRSIPFMSRVGRIAAAIGAIAFTGVAAVVSSGAATVGGTIGSDTTWTIAGSPYVATSSVTVASNVTLTIDPGVTVQFTNGTGMTIRGRLLAEGNPTNRIVFTRHPGGTSWTRLDFIDNTLESRISHADLAWGVRSTSDGNIRGTRTKLHLDHLVWTNITGQLLDLNDSSVQLLNSVLPSINAAELYHHSILPTNGYAIVRGNTFGSSGGGVNDIIDFTGGQRPGAILQLYDNVFLGGTDDALDLDGTDAHIEGNIFMNFHADGGPGAADTASAISGGRSGSITSRITIARNLLYNCDRGILCKEQNFYVVQNNTFVKMDVAALNFNEPLRSGVTPGSGVIFQGNIVWNTPQNFENVTTNSIAASFNILSASDHTNKGPGNIVADPMLVGTNGVTAANIALLFSLLTNSPAIGTGPNGLDRGALVSPGASVSGEPPSITTQNFAALTVAGPGIASYVWRTNDGPWSIPVPLTNSFSYTTNLFSTAAPLVLSNLADGVYTVYVRGINSAGVVQDTNSPAISRSWVVQLDTDGDSMPDAWEIAFGSDPLVANADGDIDSDGLKNIQEYWAGTNPTNFLSAVRLAVEGLDPDRFILSFEAVSNRTYAVETRSVIEPPGWSNFVEVASEPTTRPIVFTNLISPGIAPVFRLRVQPE